MTLLLNYGNAVTGQQRFARLELEQRFIRILMGSAGVKMFGLRRIGKSTLRLFAMEYFEENKHPYAYIDSQGLHSLHDLLSRLAQAMPGEKGLLAHAINFVSTGPASAALHAVTKGTDFEGQALSAYWQVVSEAIRKALRSATVKPVLIIDEFSYLIDNMIKHDTTQGRIDADKLLASMREWRGEGMKMLLTGSLGIAAIARQHQLNAEHLNDLQPFSVPELSEAEAEEFIRQATEVPSKGKWTTNHTAAFLKEAGVFYPCFLVRGLLEINVENPASPEAFPEIFAESVRPDLHADFYSQFDRRFKSYSALPNQQCEKLVLPALKAIMNAALPCNNDNIPCDANFTRVDLSIILTMLAEDGYVHFIEDASGNRSWKPATRLSKLWWSRSKLA